MSYMTSMTSYFSLHCCKLLETKVYVSYVVCCHSNDHTAARAYPLLENKSYSSGTILLKNIPQKLAIITTEVKTGLFATVNRI